MDPPNHGPQRKAVNKITSGRSLNTFGEIIRERTVTLLDSLPVGEEFDWVETVSIELTTMMLATLFDFPHEDRHKLTRWSDVTTAEAGSPIVGTQEERIAELMECLEYFSRLKRARPRRGNGRSTQNRQSVHRQRREGGDVVLLRKPGWSGF